MRWTIQHYIHFLRRQHVHIQHIHALVFAGVITSILAFLVLYFEYGFFHEKYSKQQVVFDEKIKEKANEKIESPTEMIFNLFKEGKERFSNIGTASYSIDNVDRAN